MSQFELFGKKNTETAKPATAMPAETPAPQPSVAKPEDALTSEEQHKQSVSVFNAGVAALQANDYVKALSLFEKAAEQGDAKAQYNCGLMYSNGNGTAVDNAKAFMWFEKAAEQGHADAQFLCAGMYYKGDGTAVDKEKALIWSEKAAEQGHADAQFLCGALYYNGDGTKMDKEKALIWFEKAAEQGLVQAQFFCGLLKQSVDVHSAGIASL